LRWERDYLLGRLLEIEARHEVHVGKLQDQLILVRGTLSHYSIAMLISSSKHRCIGKVI
jgi:hypothetical protein